MTNNISTPRTGLDHSHPSTNKNNMQQRTKPYLTRRYTYSIKMPHKWMLRWKLAFHPFYELASVCAGVCVYLHLIHVYTVFTAKCLFITILFHTFHTLLTQPIPTLTQIHTLLLSHALHHLNGNNDTNIILWIAEKHFIHGAHTHHKLATAETTTTTPHIGCRRI